MKKFTSFESFINEYQMPKDNTEDEKLDKRIEEINGTFAKVREEWNKSREVMQITQDLRVIFDELVEKHLGDMDPYSEDYKEKDNDVDEKFDRHVFTCFLSDMVNEIEDKDGEEIELFDLVAKEWESKYLYSHPRR